MIILNKKRLLYVGLFFLGFGVKSAFSSQEIICRFDSIATEIDKIAFYEGKKADSLVCELYRISREYPEQVSLPIQSIYREALVSHSQGVNDTALISELAVCLSNAMQVDNLADIALLNHSLALANMTKSNYAEAFDYALRALEQFRNINDSVFISRTFNALGNICDYIGSYNMAEDYYKQALRYSRPVQMEYYKALLNLYSCFSKEAPLDKGVIDSLLYFVSLSDQYKDRGLLSVAYLNLGACYSIHQEYGKAFECYSFLLELIRTIDNNKLTIVLYQNLGMYHTQNHDYEEARICFGKAKNIAEEDGNLARLAYVLLGLSLMHESMENTDSAYIYLKEYNSVNEKLSGHAQAIEAYQAYVSVAMESYQKELTIAGQELQLRNRRLIVTIVIAVFIGVLGLLAFVILQQKKKQQDLIKEAENRDLSERLKHEQKIKQLQAKQHQQALEAKAREVASCSLLLSEKNNVLKQIAELTISPAKNAGDSEEVNAQINQIIQKNLHADQDWEAFMLHFDKVHPSFFDKLKVHCGSLTENNLRLCAYFRIGLSVKEVAQILNVSTETCKTTRYRLKKKLGLTEDESLDDFLRNI